MIQKEEDRGKGEIGRERRTQGTAEIQIFSKINSWFQLQGKHNKNIGAKWNTTIPFKAITNVCAWVCVRVSNQACSSCSALALSSSKPLCSSTEIFFLRASSSTGTQREKREAKRKEKWLKREIWKQNSSCLLTDTLGHRVEWYSLKTTGKKERNKTNVGACLTGDGEIITYFFRFASIEG